MADKVDRAARRLLDSIETPHAIREVSRSARLATALQAVVKAHVLDGDSASETDDTNALVSGLASAIGWLLSFQPRHMRAAAIKYLVDQAIIAAEAHTRLNADPLEPKGNA